MNIPDPEPFSVVIYHLKFVFTPEKSQNYPVWPSPGFYFHAWPHISFSSEDKEEEQPAFTIGLKPCSVRSHSCLTVFTLNPRQIPYWILLILNLLEFSYMLPQACFSSWKIPERSCLVISWPSIFIPGHTYHSDERIEKKGTACFHYGAKTLLPKVPFLPHSFYSKPDMNS